MYLFRLNINTVEAYFYSILLKLENKPHVVHMSHKTKCSVDRMGCSLRIKRDKLQCVPIPDAY